MGGCFVFVVLFALAVLFRSVFHYPEIIGTFPRWKDVVVKLFDNAVLLIKGQNLRLYVVELFSIGYVFRGADDDGIALLAASGCSAVQDTAAGAWLPKEYIRRDALAVVLVPDVHEFQGQDACPLADLGIERDGSVVVQIASGNVNAVQFGPENFYHGKGYGCTLAC